jgi:uncharacterized protein YdeI (YjbR/CyaY-like superfamily)
MDAIFFASPDEFRAWLAEYHADEKEVLVGFYKKSTGMPTLTWSESVDQALCYGWIDGVRRSLGADGYAIRFTPRKPNSIWSNVNVAKVQQLTEASLMHPAGLAAFERRRADKTGVYSFEGERGDLGPEYEAEFRRDHAAWSWLRDSRPATEVRRHIGSRARRGKRRGDRASLP